VQISYDSFSCWFVLLNLVLLLPLPSREIGATDQGVEKYFSL